LAVSIKNSVDKINISPIRSFNQEDLIGPDSEASIRQTPPGFGREMKGFVCGINHDEIVARTLHFGERNFHDH
jgi:hypothetical protein